MLKTQPESQIGECLSHSATAHSCARPVSVMANTFEPSVEKVNGYSSNVNEHRVKNKQVSGVPSYPSMGTDGSAEPGAQSLSNRNRQHVS